MLDTKKICKYLSIATVVACINTALASKLPPVKTTSRKVNLQRYAGRWYEIASFPAFFQRNCTCTQAFYRPMRNHIQVINSCQDTKDKRYLNVATGKAFVVPNSNNSKLKVQFFWPFKGDYWILYVSPGYKYAVVGNPKRNYLWILSRSAKITKTRFKSLTRIAYNQGFDLSKLNITKQNCPYRPPNPSQSNKK